MTPKDSSLFLEIAKSLMSVPAAPYHEQAMSKVVRQICSDHKIQLRSTRCGNLIATVKKGKAGRPMVTAAHMDHPGFDIKKQLEPTQWKADFLGGVPDRYFKNSTRLRLQPGNHPALLGERLHAKKKHFALFSRTAPKLPPTHAVWDLKPFQKKGNMIHGRACDDLIGLASALTTLILLNKSRKAVHAIALITRAEEVGFHGALMETIEKKLPKNPLILSLETSSEMPPVKQGEGVIIRVGDRSSVFDSQTTRFLGIIAESLKKKDSGFKYQRALMQGGSCEGTAFQEFGYQTGALCVALGNYHNCGPEDIVREENIHLHDALGMVQLLTRAAHDLPKMDSLNGRVTSRLQKLRSEAEREFSSR